MTESRLKRFVQLMVQQLTGMTPTAPFSLTQYITCSPFANKNKCTNNADFVTSLQNWSIDLLHNYVTISRFITVGKRRYAHVCKIGINNACQLLCHRLHQSFQQTRMWHFTASIKTREGGSSRSQPFCMIKWELRTHHRLYSEHFVSRRPSKDLEDVDYVPTIFKDAKWRWISTMMPGRAESTEENAKRWGSRGGG